MTVVFKRQNIFATDKYFGNSKSKCFEMEQVFPDLESSIFFDCETIFGDDSGNSSDDDTFVTAYEDVSNLNISSGTE